MRPIHVTEALSILDRDYNNVPPRKRKRYMELGRKFHSFALGWVKMRDAFPFDPPEEIRSFFEKFIEWFDRTIEEIIDTEIIIENRDFHYVGRIDLIARIKGDRGHSILDLKRAWAVDRATGFQLEAYRRAAERKFHRRFRRKGGILIPPDGPCRMIEFRDHDTDWAGFLYSLNLKRILG